MIVRVLRDTCQGHARCWAQAPGIFELDDEGYIKAGDIAVPDGQEKAAWRGAKSCPERALVIDESAPTQA